MKNSTKDIIIDMWYKLPKDCKFDISKFKLSVIDMYSNVKDSTITRELQNLKRNKVIDYEVINRKEKIYKKNDNTYIKFVKSISELLQSNPFVEIHDRLVELYPVTNEKIFQYESAYNTIRSMKPVISDMKSVLTITFNKNNGYKLFKYSCYFGNYTSITYNDWDKILGIYLTDKTLSKINEIDITCHVLYHMTYLGFSEYDIQKNIRGIG